VRRRRALRGPVLPRAARGPRGDRAPRRAPVVRLPRRPARTAPGSAWRAGRSSPRR
jgi:hypothetical protein